MLRSSAVEVTGKLIVDYNAREWCKLPYPDHPHGCPNYNHKPTCPPQVCKVENWCDLSDKLWFVIVTFDLDAHVKKMLYKYPQWSERQAKCVLYWQPTVNKRLEDKAKLFCAFKNLQYTTCPEAMGVNVIKTAKTIGIPITTHPKHYVYKIALIAVKRLAQEVMLLDV